MIAAICRHVTRSPNVIFSCTGSRGVTDRRARLAQVEKWKAMIRGVSRSSAPKRLIDFDADRFDNRAPFRDFRFKQLFKLLG